VTFFELLQRLLTCAADALDATQHPAPTEQHVVVGLPVHENCCDDDGGDIGGQLTVNLTRYYPSRTFPEEDATIVLCAPPFRAADIDVEIIRCAPFDREVNGLTCDPTIAGRVDSDASAVWSGVVCCLVELHSTDPYLEWVVRQQIVVGPEGGCVGTRLSISVGFPGECGCE
jgi:hypothetical protein